jgi:hypothetical protein
MSVISRTAKTGRHISKGLIPARKVVKFVFVEVGDKSSRVGKGGFDCWPQVYKGVGGSQRDVDVTLALNFQCVLTRAKRHNGKTEPDLRLEARPKQAMTNGLAQ